jgi:hypothetical protein
MNSNLKKAVWQFLNQTKSSVSQNTSYQIVLGCMLLSKLQTDGHLVKSLDNENDFRCYSDRVVKESLLPNAVVDFFQYKFLNVIATCEFQYIRELMHNVLSVFKDSQAFGEEISNFIIEMSKMNQQTFSSAIACNIMKNILKIKKSDFVFDPFAGVGENLLSSSLKNNKTFAIEVNTDIRELLEINAHVKGYENFKSILSDTFNYTEILQADKIITEPPLALKYHLTPELYHNLVNNEKIKYSKVSKASSDWLAIEYILSSLKEDGVAAVLVAAGALMRTTEKNIREQIINDDVIEAVIELPKNALAPYASVQCCVLVLNKSKRLKKQIISIDLNNAKRASFESIINESYHNHKMLPDISCIFDNASIIENDCNLVISQIIENEKLKTNLAGMIQLKDVVEDVFRGMQVTTTKTSQQKAVGDSNCYLLNTSNIVDGEIIIAEDDMVYATPKALRSFAIYENDLIITSRGTFKTSIALEQTDNVIVSNNIIVIRLNQQKYDPFVLQKYFESDLGKQVIASVQTGSTATTIINPKNLAEIMIPDINMKLMKELSAVIQESTRRYKETIIKAQNDFDNTTQDVFNKMKIGGQNSVK